jgi:antitoxin component of RelBE/YafQ-DinJ toxin-antitoxin module
MQVEDIRVTIRVERDLKEQAEVLFNYLGLNISNAINIFLRKAVEQRGIPFPVIADKSVFGSLDTGEVASAFNLAVNQEIDQKRKKGLPVARFDTESGRAYLENADGTREYV